MPFQSPRRQGVAPGVDSFDTFCSWRNGFGEQTGVQYVLTDKTGFTGFVQDEEFTDEIRAQVTENIEVNVVETIRAHPETTFYVYFPPYSVAWWEKKCEEGSMGLQLSAEQLIIERLLSCDNVRLFGFENPFEMTSDLDIHIDYLHFVGWVNSALLEKMVVGEDELTLDNYRANLDEVYDYYRSFDYASLYTGLEG